MRCQACGKSLHQTDLCVTCEKAVRLGMAVGAAIIAWADAIRVTYPWCKVVERHYWHGMSGKQYYDCLCPGCGRQVKRRDASVDEGTDSEWCGGCRP